LAKKKFSGIQEAQHPETIRRLCGVSRDKNGKYIGKYVYLSGEADQVLLEQLCESWLETYKQDDSFYLTIDLETQGLDPINCQILLVSVSWNGRHAAVFSPYFLWGKKNSTGVGRSYELWLEVLRTIPINNQNTKFDGKFLLAKYKILINYLFCTLSGAQLGWPGAFPGDRFALDVIAKNLLKPIELSKELQTSFVGQPVEQEFTEDQVAYAASDTLITHRLFPKIKQRLVNEGLWHLWEEMECKCISFLTKSEYKGILVDNDAINTSYETNLDKVYQLELALNEEYLKIPEDIRPVFPKEIFNAKSYKQILEVADVLGIKLSGTGLDILKEIRVQHPHKILDLLVDHKEIYTRYIKTIKKWVEECINPVTGCIHPTYYVNGAWRTSRLSCVDESTELLTDSGYKKIVDILPDVDKVKTHTGRLQTVSDLIYKGEEEMFEVELENGQKILCTKEHQFYHNGQWKHLDSLEIGSSITIDERQNVSSGICN